MFTVYYLIAAEQADEKVRKVRGMLTVAHLRVSWNKPTTPYLNFVTSLMRPRFMRYPPRAIRIPRPSNSDYKDPVKGWLYFDGPLSALKNHTKVVLDIPGGGFVAMDPRTNDDKLFAWAGKTGLPVLSLDYRKAPEYPYPYALNECFDVYNTIVASRGKCLGLSGDSVPKIVITGDSAGGNLATALTLMIVESGTTGTRQFLGQKVLPIPDGLILIYPGLDMNIGNWMSDEQMSLIKDRRMRKTNRTFIRQKSMQYTMTAGTPHHSDIEEDSPPKIATPPVVQTPDTIQPRPNNITLPSPQFSTAAPTLLSPTSTRRPSIPSTSNQTSTPATEASASHHPAPLQTRLAMSSMISYFNDRILSPEMMRAMIILYIGPHNRPDFSSDYLLCPILAPDSLLERFPKTYFLTGERDPLVDDTVIFAGRIRRAKAEKFAREGLGGKEFDDRDVVEVVLIPGISHGFLQFAGIFPEGWKYIFRCGRWIEHIFAVSEERDRDQGLVTPGGTSGSWAGGLVGPGGGITTPGGVGGGVGGRYHNRRKTGESSGDDDPGLEMTMLSPKSKSKSKALQFTAAEERKRKEGLLREQLKERSMIGRSSSAQEKGDRGNEREKLRRKKSMVSLASEDDLLGRRMLGLAGPLTGMGFDDE